MSLKKFFKHFKYTIQVSKKLNEILAEDDLSALTAPDEYEPLQVSRMLKDSKAFFSYAVADILVNENKTPKDIGSLNLARAFSEYFIEFAKGRGDYLKPDTIKDTIKKYIRL
jgi:hypothetical protein